MSKESSTLDDIHVQKINDDIAKLEEDEKSLHSQLDELDKQIASKNTKCFVKEIAEFKSLVDNPSYEFEVREKEEILNNLNFYADEYKSLIKEIQEALDRKTS
ncbi:hypothetical protein M9Y10_028797 [Tritrichomonas musculus]|uniref:Uncharacterized protein n=1 Tax=Tritrichomonas musculus TaxID=1915356 RepID=A0ABR2KKD0_9EUKA